MEKVDNINNKELVIFDLDGTLTPSKSPLEPDMADLLLKLLAKKKVAVISGGGFPQFETQFLNRLPTGASQFSNLLLLPTSGTRLNIWRGTWCEEYAEHLGLKEKEKIMNALDSGLRAIKYEQPAKLYGPAIEDRGSQITFSALGQNAPLNEKMAWDPTREKRESIAAVLRQKIPEFDVRVGGATSLDITKKGVNKGYGIRKLEQFLNIGPETIVFVGDALFLGGNDYPARATGIDCVSVTGPDETKKLIADWLDKMKNDDLKSGQSSALGSVIPNSNNLKQITNLFNQKPRIFFSGTKIGA